jgi:DnaJ-class molecular chaperone
MPIFEGTGHGDLYVEYNVVLPSSLNSDLKQSESFTVSLIVLFAQRLLALRLN